MISEHFAREHVGVRRETCWCWQGNAPTTNDALKAWKSIAFLSLPVDFWLIVYGYHRLWSLFRGHTCWPMLVASCHVMVHGSRQGVSEYSMNLSPSSLECRLKQRAFLSDSLLHPLILSYSRTWKGTPLLMHEAYGRLNQRLPAGLDAFRHKGFTSEMFTVSP